ncbi:MAG TPA: flavin reductase family protein [Gemmatimonadaceae bacterium]|nr:flavin reductase family protein [Gemmatimonadaceae bacterium]
MSIDPDEFRSVLGRFATGVTVVTARDSASVDHGLTVNSFASLSLTPPLILVCIDHEASLHPAMTACSHFVINILSANQEALGRRFAAPETDRFEGVGFTRGTCGAPILDDVLAYLECRAARAVPAGDHTIFIGEVEHAETRPASPLLYYRGGYAQIER